VIFKILTFFLKGFIMKKFLAILVVAILATSFSYSQTNPCPPGGGGAGTIGCEGLPGTGTGDLIVEICYEDIEVTLQTSSLDLEFLMYPGQTFYGQQLAFLATGSPGIGINHTAGVWTGTVPNNTPGITIQNSNWTTVAYAFNMAGEANYVLTYDIKANYGTTNAALYNLGFSYVVSYN
jgi:hypothetical protein